MNKKINKIMLLFFLIIFGNTYAYRWTMNNFTSKKLFIQIELLGSSNPYWVYSQPNESVDFDWSPGNAMAGFCLGKIKWALADSRTISMFVDPKTLTIKQEFIGKLSAYIDKRGNYVLPKDREALARHEAELRFLPDEIYNQTVEEAKKLSGTKVGAQIVGWFADLIAESKCRSRDIAIIEEDDGSINFYTLAN